RKIAKKHNVYFMVDAAQTAGALPLYPEKIGIDLLAFTGHKALFGPQGTGGLYIKERVELKPLKQGGTGSNSEFEEQPDFLPDKYESGTPNTVGIAGLGAGVKFILEEGIEKIKKRKKELTEYLLTKLETIKGIN
ncbi:MAG TPA: cysteine desulfurase, partial [Elusimicrobia bacterium]|nr:cysteine desulfurase [Elusimicrobiota bacterium]